MQVELLLVDCSVQDGQGERSQIFHAGDCVFSICGLQELCDFLGLLSQLFYQENGMFDETFSLALRSHLSNLSIFTLNLLDIKTDRLRLSRSLLLRLIVMPYEVLKCPLMLTGITFSGFKAAKLQRYQVKGPQCTKEVTGNLR